MATQQEPQEVPLLKSSQHHLRRSTCIVVIIGVLLVSTLVLFFSTDRTQLRVWKQYTKKNIVHPEGDSDDDSGDGTERVLYTDNPNDYLCDPDFLYELNEELDNYHFTCLYQQGPLECDDGFTLKCLASATYGNTAGGCNKTEYNEVTEAPYGCGWPYEDGPVECSDDVCEGSHSGEIDECFNLETGEEAITIDPCSDCVPMCRCGSSSPQFYNVADCFGDSKSTACVEQLGTGKSSVPNLYLPQSLWDDYCVGESSCYFNWRTSQAKQCEEEVYYEGVVVNGVASASWSTAPGYDVDDVIDLFLNYEGKGCGQPKFKILAVCEKSD